MKRVAFHLAQVNIARAREPLSAPIMAGFVSQLERINALAEQSPGFVWRLQTPAGDSTSIRVFEDERILVNLSVWDSLESLRAYVYGSDHAAVMRERRAWFEPLPGPSLALWWIAAGHEPGLDEARERLGWIQQRGPTPEAFSFRSSWPAPVSAPLLGAT